MKRLRIVVTSSHALPHVGGIEILVDKEIRALAALGHEVALITSVEGGAGETPAYPSNVRVIRIASSEFLERRFGLYLPLFSPRLLGVLFREIARCDVVYVHGWIAPNSAAALLAARTLAKASILTEHNGIQPRKTKALTTMARVAAETLGRMSARLAVPIGERAGVVLVSAPRQSGRQDVSLWTLLASSTRGSNGAALRCSAVAIARC